MYALVLGQLRVDLPRTALRIAAISSIVAVILIVEGVYAGQLIQLRNTVMQRGADLIVAQAGVSNLIAVRSVLPQFTRSEVEAVEGVSGAHPLTGIALIYEENERRTPIFLFVYDSAGGPRNIIEGRNIAEDREIVVDQSLASKYSLSPGDSFIISGFEFRIAGISAGAAAYFTSFGFILFDDLLDFYFESDLADDLSSFPLLGFLLVDILSGEDAHEIAARIEAVVPAADVLLPEQLAANDMDLGRITLGPIFRMMISIAYLIGALVTGIIMYVAISGRRRSLGILKALGFPSGYLVRLIVLEVFLLLIISLPVGAAIAAISAALIESMAPLYLIQAITNEHILRATIACGTFALLGSILPVRLIARLEPVEAFRC
jgi:putative ABC transport system permease protein